MKLWLKYCAGILAGAALYLVAPKTLFESGGFLRQGAGIALRIGYYVFLPLLVTGIPLAVMKLCEEKKFWPIALRSLIYFILSSFIAALLGILVAQIPDIARLPLLADTASNAAQGLGQRLVDLFPANLGSLSGFSGDLAMPLLLLGLIVGLAMAHDPAAAKPVANILDSASRILYTINTFITEIFSVLLIPVTADSLNSLSKSLGNGAFSSFAAILIISSMAAVFILLPIVAYFALGRENPFPLIFAFLASSLAALASGNLRFAAGTMVREGAEDLGLRRRYSSVVMPIGLVFGRAGTTFVTAMCSIFILSSYSPLAGSFGNVLLMLIVVPAATIIAGAAIPGGPIAVLTLVCGIFGKGFENGYLVVAPIALLLSIVATALDLVWVGISQILCARRLVPAERKLSQHFI
jgi:Na+/H+-dicarboxylate symporter